MGAPKKDVVEKKNKMADTHDWVLVVPAKGKRRFAWVEKNWWLKDGA